MKGHEAKELEGTARNDRPSVEVDEEHIDINCPMELTPAAKDLFKRYEKELNDDGRAKFMDGAMLASFCQLLAIYMETLETASTGDVLTLFENGKQRIVVMNNHLKAAAELAKDVSRFADLLGLSFKARLDATLKIKRKGRKRVDPLAARMRKIG